MGNWDYAIFIVHMIFWAGFGVTKLIVDRRSAAPEPSALRATQEDSAPHSKALIAFHALALAAMYYGLDVAIGQHRVAGILPGQRILARDN